MHSGWGGATNLLVLKAAARLLFRCTLDTLLRRCGAFGKKLIWLVECEALWGGILGASRIFTSVVEGAS